MLFNYYMARYYTNTLYTFELIFDCALFLILLLFYVRKIDKGSLVVFLFTGTIHAILEIFAQITETRVVQDTLLFDIIYVGFPILPIIMGFYEGGVFCLAAYHFVKIIANKDRYSTKFFSILCAITILITTTGAISMRFQLESDPSGVNFTRRTITNPFAIILMISLYSITISYFIINKKISSKDKLTVLYFYLGLVLFTFFMILPVHIFGIRYIEKDANGSYIAANLIEQVLIMYAYQLMTDAAGFFIQDYIVLYHFVYLKDR